MKRILFFISASLLIVISSCTTTYDGAKNLRLGRLVKDTDLEKSLSRALSLYEMGEIEAAIAILRSVIERNRYSPAIDKAYELVITWLLQTKQKDDAKLLASFFLKRHRESPAAQKIINLFDGPEDFKSDHLDQSNLPESDQDLLDEDVLEKLFRLEQDLLRSQDEDAQKDHFFKLKEFVFESASLALVESIAQSKKSRPSLGLACARMANHHFHHGDFVSAYNYASFAIGLLPKHEQKFLIDIQKDIDQIRAVNPKALGIILPLSGPFAAFGKKILAAMGIAWRKQIEIGDDKIIRVENNGQTLVIADSKGDADTAAEMVDDLVKRHMVAMILGDITKDASLSAAIKSQTYGVPIISFSRHPLVADVGKSVFVFNSSPNQQIKDLVNHSINVLGNKNFAILYPRHNYGISMATNFYEQVIEAGASITAIETYDPHQTTFTEPIRKLIGMHFLKDRSDLNECLDALTILDDDTEKKRAADECRKNTRPIVDFDALFIPEFQKLAYIIPALIQEDLLLTKNPQEKLAYSLATKNKDPKHVQLLGANSWNDDETLKKFAGKVDGAFFVDSVSFSQGEKSRTFLNAYLKLNLGAPSSLEYFAHDAALFASIIMAKDLGHKALGREALTKQIAEFFGRVGILANFSFNKEGLLKTENLGFELYDGKPHIRPLAKKSGL